MPHKSLLIVLPCLFLVLILSPAAHAQYILPYDTIGTAVADSTDSTKAAPQSVEDADQEQENIAPENPIINEKAVVEQAVTWVRRLLFRSAFNMTEIGAFSQYQITSWSEGRGAYGPVEARITVAYLGTSGVNGKPAEWIQASYQTVDDEPFLVEFDLTVPSAPRINQIHRAFYRVNRDIVKSISFNLPANSVDQDSLDRPMSDGAEDVNLYSGSYHAEKFRGVGADGVDVVYYRVDSLPPLGILRLGYGDKVLTYTGGGSDAVSRFATPGR
ncbi:hypothetical protein EHM69_11910 [candidate division KSB1 bacterium]|nr:MAG: hypothetical protein EHM69_11910 [candidate division KSB1 bacterium]